MAVHAVFHTIGFFSRGQVSDNSQKSEEVQGTVELDSEVSLTDGQGTEQVTPSEVSTAAGPSSGLVLEAANVLVGPHQPRSKDLFGGSFPRRQILRQRRSFQETWYSQFPWLEYSEKVDSAFCFACRLAEQSGKHGHYDACFTERGFRNWKTALDDYRKHESSHVHCLAAAVWNQARHVAESGTLANACSAVQDIRNVLGVVNSLYKLLEGSAKRHSRFQAIQEKLGGSSVTLKRLCETRWSSRYEAVHAIKSSFDAIIHTLEAISTEDAELGPEASCLLKSVQTFHFFFYISVLEEVLGKTAVLSRYLQGRRVELSGVKSKVSSTIKAVGALREDFQDVWKNTEDIASKLSLELPQLPRKRKVAQRLAMDGGGTPYYPQSCQEQYKLVYNEVVDIVRMEMKERFRENEYEVLAAVEKLLVDSLTESRPDRSSLQTVCTFYGNDFNSGRLEHELEIFYGNIQAYQGEPDWTVESEEGTDLPELVKVRTFFNKGTNRDCYPETCKLLKTLLVIPASSSECERSFSTLRRLKTWLRTSMGQERLTSLALLTVEREECRKLECRVEDLVAEFGSSGRRRLLLN